VLKPVLVVSAFLLAGGTSPAVTHSLSAAVEAVVLQAPASPPAATPLDTKNPVKATAESQAKAKKMYGYDCAMCHGDNGNGKTDMAADVGPLTDLSEAKTLTGKTDAEIYDVIKNGKGKMPGEDGPRARPDELWNLVIYVRGLGKK